MLLNVNLKAVLLLCATLNVLHAAVVTNPDWWTHGVFYQIYPRSFKDSNGDGIGDVRGIISKLDHLQDAGVTAAWLSPIFKSPQVDQGYDISDFRDIEPAYGTIQDVEELIIEAHKRGIKIIMDFVPNHTSNQHAWFKASEARTPGFEDYYVWRDGVGDGPPTNWISVFQDSQWEYSTIRKQYYLHQFATAQPDLNYRSDDVVKEMKAILKFWMEKGVDGFRIDAVPFLFEDVLFRNEPRSNIPNVPAHLPESLQRIYTQNLPETYDMIYQFRKFLDDYSNEKGGDPRIIMTEVYADLSSTMYYYGNEKDAGAHFTFNFFLIMDLRNERNARMIVSIIEQWMKNMPKKYIANWVLGNHDNNRVATRFGPKTVDNYNILIALLPGIMVTYNGEEIGQEDGEVTYEQGFDPNACKSPKEDFAKLSRDFERTPFHWDDTANAGFTTGQNPWLPVSSKYKVTNLKAQQDPNVPSHYQIYKQLTKLRQEDAFKNGDLTVRAVNDNVVVFSRALKEKNLAYLVILNIGSANTTVNIDRQLFSATTYLEVVLASVTSNRKKGDLIPTENLQVQESEGLVVITTTRTETTSGTSTFRMHCMVITLTLLLSILVLV